MLAGGVWLGSLTMALTGESWNGDAESVEGGLGGGDLCCEGLDELLPESSVCESVAESALGVEMNPGVELTEYGGALELAVDCVGCFGRACVDPCAGASAGAALKMGGAI